MKIIYQFPELNWTCWIRATSPNFRLRWSKKSNQIYYKKKMRGLGENKRINIDKRKLCDTNMKK